MKSLKNILLICVLSPLLILSCSKQEERRDTHELLNAVLWMQHSAEYKALTTQAFNTAKVMIDVALQDIKWTAALEQKNNFAELPPAIILDVDETLLDNSPYEATLIQSNSFYNRDSWKKWCEEKRATAIPGALALCNYANQKGITVFYVTNRREENLQATKENLRVAGFPLNKKMETVIPRSDSGDKGKRRSQIASDYRILLLVGDNNGDFASAFTKGTMAQRDSLTSAYQSYWGTRWIVLPNPAYGDWEGALIDYNYRLSDFEKLQMKYNALRN